LAADFRKYFAKPANKTKVLVDNQNGRLNICLAHVMKPQGPKIVRANDSSASSAFLGTCFVKRLSRFPRLNPIDGDGSTHSQENGARRYRRQSASPYFVLVRIPHIIAWHANCLFCTGPYNVGPFLEPSVKLMTLCILLLCVLSMAHLSLGQTVTLNVKSKEVHHDSAVRVELFLNAPSDSAPAGLQWEFKVPPALQIVECEEGKAVRKAGKTLVCNGAKCLIYGLNRTTIPNGQIAVVSFKFDQRSIGAKGSTNFGYQGHDGARARKQEIGIENLVGVSLHGKTILVAPDTLPE
jgi:hypothetical protein